MYTTGFGMGFMFQIIPFIIAVVFIFVIGRIIIVSARGVAQWDKNNSSPVLTVSAQVVVKRSDVSGHTHMHNDDMHMNHMSSRTTYYATFEVESGDRMELHVSGAEYGLLAEGDTGRLTFQGTRYMGFERDA